MTQRKKENAEAKETTVVQKKTAFIVTPIGPDNSETRRATDGLIQSVLRPALERAGYKADASHEEDDLGSISRKIIDHLINDDLVVVNLTRLNANVMYELGIRHATMKPVILMAEAGTILPFDTQDQRTVIYRDDMAGVVELSKKLDSLLSSADKLSNNEGNPIYMTGKDNLVERSLNEKLSSSNASEQEKGLIEMVLDRMASLESRITKAASHEAFKSPFNSVSGGDECADSVLKDLSNSISGFAYRQGGSGAYYMAAAAGAMSTKVRAFLEEHSIKHIRYDYKKHSSLFILDPMESLFDDGKIKRFCQAEEDLF